jgi:hypothetical protein
MCLREDRRRLLADPLELRSNEIGSCLVAAAGLEPVGKLVQVALDLALLIASSRDRKGRAADAIDRVLVHGLKPRPKSL